MAGFLLPERFRLSTVLPGDHRPDSRCPVLHGTELSSERRDSVLPYEDNRNSQRKKDRIFSDREPFFLQLRMVLIPDNESFLCLFRMVLIPDNESFFHLFPAASSPDPGSLSIGRELAGVWDIPGRAEETIEPEIGGRMEHPFQQKMGKPDGG